MGSKEYLLALDQGTTSSRAVLFDRHGRIVSMAQKEFTQFYPSPGWVEHDPMEIWATQIGVAGEALARVNVSADQVAALGITNQRETAVVWDRNTGKPVYNAIVWQCRRTREICEDLKARGWSDYVRRNTGLMIDSYFSGTKIKWILDHVEGARDRASRGELLFGTVDSWLLWNLSGGKLHATDVTNASRTMLFNIRSGNWDEELLEALDVPAAMMPRVMDSADDFGQTCIAQSGLAGIPIRGIAGDQQSALFGQRCFERGRAKNTYGTGCFLLMNIGDEPLETKSGLLTTVAWGLGGKMTYALEGSIFMAGAIVQWLRDEMGLLASADESDALARSITDNGGVYLVPAFTGLGAPYWDMDARGAILGLTRGTGRAHVVRAGLEAIAYQTRDVLSLMEQEAGIKISQLSVDGGAVRNDFLMQFQADLLGTQVCRPRLIETTAFGAAALAGLSVGVYTDLVELEGTLEIEQTFIPQADPEESDRLYGWWKRAVERSAGWASESEGRESK